MPNLFDQDTIDRVVAAEELREALQQTVDSNVTDLTAIDGQAMPSIALRLGDVSAGYRESASTQSASAAKAYWVAAAVDAVGIEAVEPFVEAIFVHSDNDAAGRVIDLVGVDGINTYTASIGMEDTFLASWFFGRRRAASNAGQDGFPTNNETTAADALTFLSQLEDGELFDAQETSTMLGWMLLAPDNMSNPQLGYGGVLTDELDPWVAATSMHKAGWLPPNCCRSIGNVLITIGIVPLPSSDPLTIAVSTVDGSDYEADRAWISTLVGEIVSAASPR